MEVTLQTRLGTSEIILRQDPRHGLWTVSFSRGAIPDSLTGRWQNLSELKTKINYYLKTREKNKTELIDD